MILMTYLLIVSRYMSCFSRYKPSLTLLKTRNFISMSANQVIILSGATSSGKSNVAKELCRTIDAEIVIADSVQMYKYANIGSTKPSDEERKSVPHHLVDFQEPSETLTSGDYARMAATCIHDILSRGKTPIVVGGTTMLLDWLIHGIPDAPKATDAANEEALRILKPFIESNNWSDAYAFVGTYTKSNIARYEKLNRNDWYRLRRHLEVELSLGWEAQSRSTSSMASPQDKELPPAAKTAPSSSSPNSRYFLTGLDVRCFFLTESRHDLYRTIDERCIQLLQAGLLEEVTDLLLTEKLPPGCMVARSIGYRQTIDYLCRDNPGLQDAMDSADRIAAFEAFIKYDMSRLLPYYSIALLTRIYISYPITRIL